MSYDDVEDLIMLASLGQLLLLGGCAVVVAVSVTLGVCTTLVLTVRRLLGR